MAKSMKEVMAGPQYAKKAKADKDMSKKLHKSGKS